MDKSVFLLNIYVWNVGYMTDLCSGVRRLEDSAKSNISGAKIFTNIRKTLEAVGEKRENKKKKRKTI